MSTPITTLYTLVNPKMLEEFLNPWIRTQHFHLSKAREERGLSSHSEGRSRRNQRCISKLWTILDRFGDHFKNTLHIFWLLWVGRNQFVSEKFPKLISEIPKSMHQWREKVCERPLHFFASGCLVCLGGKPRPPTHCLHMKSTDGKIVQVTVTRNCPVFWKNEFVGSALMGIEVLSEKEDTNQSVWLTFVFINVCVF